MKFALVRETFHPPFLHMLVPRWLSLVTVTQAWQAAGDSEFISVGLPIDGVRQKDLGVLIGWVQLFTSFMKMELAISLHSRLLNNFHYKLLFSFGLHLPNSNVFSLTFSTLVVCSGLDFFFFSPSQEIGIICFQEHACGKLAVNVKYIHLFLWRALPPAYSGKEPEIWQGETLGRHLLLSPWQFIHT